jgi:hypothetical protein
MRPEEKQLLVQAFPRRVAHATYALLVASREHNAPVTASEIAVYDTEALDARATGRTLQRAARYQLAGCVGRYWIPSNSAREFERALEARFLNEVAL